MDERALEKSNFLTPGPKTETGRIDAGIMKNLSRADLAHRRQTGTQTGENGERVNVLRGTETRSEATRFLGADWQRKTCINRERSHETSRSELEQQDQEAGRNSAWEANDRRRSAMNRTQTKKQVHPDLVE
jgi:hypothetical protein